MGRIVWIVGLTFAVCALVAGSWDFDRWSGAAQAALLVIGGATVLMNVERALNRRVEHPTYSRRHRHRQTA